VVPHRQAGARLAVLRDRRDDVARTDLRQRREAALEVLGAVQLEQDLAELLVDRDRSVRGGVRATGDPDVDLPEGDLVGDLDRGLQAGAAGRWMSVAGVSAESFEPRTDSRARLKSRECLSTAPATTSPTR
jgi:hypothetical protein